MRRSHITTTAATVAVFLLLTSSLQAQSAKDSALIVTESQVTDCTAIHSFEFAREPKNTILAEDYPFLKSIECLKRSDFIKSRGWNLTLKHVGGSQTTHYELRGKGPRISVKATYDKDGNLNESILRTWNTRIPPAIRLFIFSDEYNGWTMIGNEKIVKDFDPYQTEYNITLSNGLNEQVLNFKEYGNTVAFSEN